MMKIIRLDGDLRIRSRVPSLGCAKDSVDAAQLTMISIGGPARNQLTSGTREVDNPEDLHNK